MARPISTSFSPEERKRITMHICEELTKKRPLYKILAEDKGLCSAAQFAVWQRDDPELAESVARAREVACEMLIEETIEIADSKQGDANSRKVRIYAREKAAAMLAPRKYGQRLDVTSGGKPLEAAPPVSLVFDQRVQALFTLAAQRAAGLLAAPASLDDVMS